MKRRIPPSILSATGLLLLSLAGASDAQFPLATGEDADVTAEGLHRVDPSIMVAAWVKPDLDLSRYTRVLLVPTAVQFREVRGRRFNARTRISRSDFPLDDENKEWVRETWHRAIETEFARERTYELYDGDGEVSNVLAVQALLVDVVSRIPPDDVGSAVTVVKDPWSVSAVLELRDAATAELLARTIDRRNAEGFVDPGTVWVQTENLLERWAQVLADRLEELADLSRGNDRAPTWAR